MMMKYNVKVNLVLWYDKNFEIEAEDEKQAEEIAKNMNNKIAYLENETDWEFNNSDVTIAYVEEE